ncbi:MAG: LPS export ABC transporter periplasmic protein LptC [Candidatus Omnitrophica bacterium]|nr:LPS export ABC transporter periplasmic protein LptC [Candidatus Omnitrophota bacterium]
MKLLKNRKILFVAILATLIAVNGFFKREHVPVAPKVENESLKESLSEIKQEVYSFKVEGFNKDKKVEWELEGESATVVFDKINIKNLKAVYHGNEVTFELFADTAVYDKKTQDIELKDNIVGRSSDGGELVTDFAKWSTKKEEITTDSYVIVKRENLICRGKGLVTRPRFKWVSFNAEIEVDFGEDKKITCNGPFEIDHEKNIAIFNNNVKVADKDSDMFSDKLTVFFDPQTNEVKRVVTEGNVKVTHRGPVEDIGNIGKVSF